MTLGNLLGPKCKIPEERPWKLTGERCPRCGDRMIENRKYIECGAMHCTYIKVRKKGE